MGATLADVARLAGVSLSTASRVLSGSPYGVKEELRDRVLDAARTLNYVANAHARALRAATTTVGVIVHDVSDPYFAEIVRGIQRVAADAGRLVIICNTHRDPEREVEYVRMLRAQRVEAIILAGSGHRERGRTQQAAAQISAFAENGGRVAFIGRHHMPGDAVLPDNEGGAFAMGQALLDLGHRRFGVLSGPPLLTAVQDRMEGFRRALSGAGVTLGPEQVVACDFSRDGGADGVRRLLAQAPDVTAIFALNDAMAVGALSVLREKGVRVPEQVSVAGFDDYPFAADVTPRLSTVQVPMVAMGEQAMQLVLRAAEPQLHAVPLATRVILRESSGPSPSAKRL